MNSDGSTLGTTFAETASRFARPILDLSPKAPSVSVYAADLVSNDLRPAPEDGADAMVEVNGIEPSTSCLQSRRSPN
jgi:hypothetical protein